MLRKSRGQIMGDVRMARNASKKLLHVSACSFFFSLGITLILGCITIAPEIEPYCELLFYSFGVICITSLSIFLYVCVRRTGGSDRRESDM